MKLQLQVSIGEVGRGLSVVKRFSFAVVDLDKAENYPLNFVSMLPVNVSPGGKPKSAFVNVFGDKSCEVAKQLLLDALDQETTAEVKVEIERRLRLLEPKSDLEQCHSCGKTFQVKPKKGYRQKFCPDCMKKKFGGRK